MEVTAVSEAVTMTHCQWLKVKPAAGIVIGGHCLGVAIQHDGLKARVPAPMDTVLADTNSASKGFYQQKQLQP